jgi:ligand-binding sensor domain-containing protein
MRMRKIIYRIQLLAICLAACFSVKAQLPQDLKITNFDGSTGFYSRVVSSVLKDTKGFLWIGTSDGLYRYDGYAFRNYRKLPNDTNNLSDNYITHLALGKDNKIWMGLAKGGISSFDPASGKFRNYPLISDGKPVTGAVTMLLVDHKNEVWFAIRQKGLWHVNTADGSFDSYNIVSDHDIVIPREKADVFNTVSAGIEAKPGLLWLGTYNGFYQFNTETRKFKSRKEKPFTPGVFREDDFISIAKDGDILWLGSWAGGLTRYNTVTHQVKIFKLNTIETKKYTTNIVSDIKVRSTNELWITSNDKGLGIFDKEKEQFHFYSDDASHRTDIPANLCYKVVTDKNDDLWLVHEWGFTRIQPREKKFRFTKVPVSKSDNQQFYYVRDMLEDETHTYIATTLADGLHVINKKTGQSKQYPVKVMPGEEPFLAIYKLIKDSKGNIWVVSRDYIYWYDTKMEKLVLMMDQPPVYPLQSGSNEFTNIAEDNEGNIWITSSRNGVFKYTPATHSYKHFYLDANDRASLNSNVVSGIAMDKKGRVWVSGVYGCLAYFDAKKNRFVNHTLFNEKKNAKAGSNVGSLLADRSGNIWAGSDAGLVQIDAGRADPSVLKVYTAQEGLRGDLAYSLKEDHDGNIWCTTPSALCMINPVTQRVNSIVLQNDVIRSITNRVYLSVTDDKLQVLTYGGYYSFDPVLFHEKQHDSVIAITSFHVKDKEYYYEESLQKYGKIKLGSTENLFSFEFGVLDYSQSDDHQYAYMLENFDKTWINAGNRRYASYTNIPGGNYVFKVKALNTYGDANSSVISIPLHVNGPFYQTWWFLLILAIIFSAVLYIFYRFRLQKEREILQLQTKAHALEKEKTQVQYENLKQHLNPHFLFNSLTSLGSLIRINQKMAVDFLDGMSRIYRYILQSKDSELVYLKDEIKFVQTFIALQKTRFTDGLLVEIDIDEEHYHQKIVPVTLQNLVENAIKHNIVDSETPLVIDLFVEDGYLFVRNNLQKKKFVETSNKQGLDNLLSLYKYLSERPMLIEENENFFTVKIPLI